MRRRHALATIVTAVALLVPFASLAQPRAGAAARSPATTAARADIEATLGFVPSFLEVAPDAALPATWSLMKSLQMSDNTKLSGKSKELIGLGVAAQIPCTYCVYAHRAFAKTNGASEQELEEANAIAAQARLRATMMAGLRIDEATFLADVRRMADGAKGDRAAAGPPVAVTDKASALREAQRVYGFVPRFLNQLPDEIVPGVVLLTRDLVASPSALSQRDKALVMLGVDAQASCAACVSADLVMAKSFGATDEEIGEAVAMAGLTRNLSTLLNGAQIDEAQFRREVDRLAAPQPGSASSSKKQ